MPPLKHLALAATLFAGSGLHAAETPAEAEDARPTTPPTEVATPAPAETPREETSLRIALDGIPDDKLPSIRRIARERSSEAAAKLRTSGSLIANGDFETDANDDGKPDDWGGAEFPSEDGNTFMRMSVEEAGDLLVSHNQLVVPFEVEALELSWDWRATDLQSGPQPWFDARIIMKFMNASRQVIGAAPAPFTRQSTDGWQSRSIQFLVPRGTVWMEFMPALFRAESGTVDFDNFALEPVDSAALIARRETEAQEKARLHVDPEAPRKENWPAPLTVVGNRLHDPEGDEVWLQGVAIPSMEWNPRGENILKSVEVAIEDWKANVIRLPLKGKFWLGEDGEAYKQLVTDVVTFAANRGVYTVLDLHHYRAARPEDAEFWGEAATAFKNHPAVLFDLLNEPHGVTWEVWRNGGFVSKKRKAADEDAFLGEEERKKNARGFQAIGMQALLDTVRETGANNIAVIGGLKWAYDLSGILEGYAIDEHEGGRGIMYSTHVYPWKRNWQKSFLDAAEHYPILVGEVGADVEKMDFMPHEIQEDPDTWAPDMLGAIQKYRLNWTAWSFHPEARPRLLMDWEYTPTPFWGEPAKAALSGKQFELEKLR